MAVHYEEPLEEHLTHIQGFDKMIGGPNKIILKTTSAAHPPQVYTDTFFLHVSHRGDGTNTPVYGSKYSVYELSNEGFVRHVTSATPSIIPGQPVAGHDRIVVAPNKRLIAIDTDQEITNPTRRITHWMRIDPATGLIIENNRGTVNRRINPPQYNGSGIVGTSTLDASSIAWSSTSKTLTVAGTDINNTWSPAHYRVVEAQDGNYSIDQNDYFYPAVVSFAGGVHGDGFFIGQFGNYFIPTFNSQGLAEQKFGIRLFDDISDPATNQNPGLRLTSQLGGIVGGLSPNTYPLGTLYNRYAITLSPNQQYFAAILRHAQTSGTRGWKVNVWRLHTSLTPPRYTEPSVVPGGPFYEFLDRPTCVQFSPSSDAIVVGTQYDGGYLYAWRWSDAGWGTQYDPPAIPPTGVVQSVRFSPNGKLVIVAHTNAPYISVYEWSSLSGFGAKLPDFPDLLTYSQGESLYVRSISI